MPSKEPQTMISSIWEHLLDQYGPAKVDFFGSLIIQLIFFWLVSLVYISLPFVAPSFSERHKIQPAPKQPTLSDIVHCAAVAGRNQLLSVALAFLLFAISALTDQPSAMKIAPSPPSCSEFLIGFVLCCVGREILFYYAHRLLHLPALYRRIHKTHHRFTASVALAAQYAHPLEHLLGNTLPIVLPALVLQVHILTFWAVLAWMLLETATVHSGYDFFKGAARMHDAHHENFNVNFGGLGWLDWLHGTGEGSREKRA